MLANLDFFFEYCLRLSLFRFHLKCLPIDFLPLKAFSLEDSELKLAF